MVCWELGCSEVPFFCWLARGSGADWRHWAPEGAASSPSLLQINFCFQCTTTLSSPIFGHQFYLIFSANSPLLPRKNLVCASRDDERRSTLVNYELPLLLKRCKCTNVWLGYLEVGSDRPKTFVAWAETLLQRQATSITMAVFLRFFQPIHNHLKILRFIDTYIRI
jgi:hypothetical protein